MAGWSTSSSACGLGCRAHWISFALLVIALVIQTGTGLVRDSAVFDEPANVRTGLAALRYGEFSPSVTGHHPPLPFMCGVLPLLVSHDVKLPSSFGALDGVRVLWQNGDGHRLLMRCRWTTVVLSLNLAVVVYAFARSLGGVASGLFALALYVFCPNVLAHSHLVTNDISACLGLTAASYALWASYKNATIGRICLAGIVTGLAIGSKLTGVLVLPLIFLLPLIRRKLSGSGNVGPWSDERWASGLLKELALSSVLIFVTLWAQYGFDVEMRRMIPIPAPAYWDAWGRFFVHARDGHPCYLAGSVSQHGWWCYYFVALAVKSSSGMLGLCAIGVLSFGRTVRFAPVGTLCIGVPSILLLVAATQSGQNIGVRHVLPLYPLSFVWLGQLASPHLQFMGRRVLLGCLLASHIIASISILPHYLAFFNVWGGGPARGSRWLADSNIDWGQGLIDLRTWMQEHEVDELALEYFGSVKPIDYGIRSHSVSEGESGWVAISINSLLGLYLPDSERFDWLRSETPYDHAGYSILIFSRVVTQAGLRDPDELPHDDRRRILSGSVPPR